MGWSILKLLYWGSIPIMENEDSCFVPGSGKVGEMRHYDMVALGRERRHVGLKVTSSAPVLVF